MFEVLRLFVSLSAARFDEFKTHTGNRALYGTLLVTFGMISLGFGVAAITLALAHWLGALIALCIMSGSAFLMMIIVLILTKMAHKRHLARALEQEAIQQRLKQAAVVSAIGMVGGHKKKALLIGLGLAGAALLAARSRGTDRS